MNTLRMNFLIGLLLIFIAVGSSACSLMQTKAQTPENKTEVAKNETKETTSESYKPPKRISKDIINKEEKLETPAKSKQK
jgi:hypothetical protein